MFNLNYKFCSRNTIFWSTGFFQSFHTFWTLVLRTNGLLDNYVYKMQYILWYLTHIFRKFHWDLFIMATAKASNVVGGQIQILRGFISLIWLRTSFLNLRLGLRDLICIRGRSITMLTCFCPILTTHVPIVDFRWHFRYHLPKVNVYIWTLRTPYPWYVPHFTHQI